MRKVKTQSYPDALRAYRGWISEAEEEALPEEADALLECRDQIADALGDEVPEDLITLDRRYLRTTRYVGEELERTQLTVTSEDPWWWHALEIAEGGYPLEKLPEHVRETARELYYGRK